MYNCEDISNYLKQWWRAYRAPIMILLLNFAIYDAFGPVTECSRCPVPPMSKFEKILFTVSYLIHFICLVWIYFIHAVRKEEHDRF